MNIEEKIKTQIQNNDMILYMKGTPASPKCGFSAQVVKILSACGAPFASIDVLEHSDIRETLPKIANWPTFPQLYIKGELIGGCDIVTELYQSGELQVMIQKLSNLGE